MSLWFNLSYAQFLTVPRLVLESMPPEWQRKMAALLREMDATFDFSDAARASERPFTLS